MFTGYLDDSGSSDTHLFTLSCLFGHGSMWQWVEWAWLNCLENKNKQLESQGRKPIRRYHAADCSGFHKDFKNWSKEEQIEFTDKLIRVFQRHNLAAISYTLDLRDLAAEFPEAKKKQYELAHVLLLIRIMAFLSEKLLDLPGYSRDRLSLIHDRSDYERVLLNTFDYMKNEGTLKNGERFTTIAPMGWEDCVPLQPADLIAYENFKIVERNSKGKKRRISMERILDLDSFGGRGASLNREALKEIRSALDEDSLRSLLEFAGIKIT